MKKRRATIILLIIFVAGLSLLLYPSVSDYINSMHQSKAITTYADEVAALNREQYDAYLQAAQEYNKSILKRGNVFALSDEDKKQYTELLDISGTGVMGYIEIPIIEVTLPIYHGTDDAVLQIAVGHLDWTSLPVGGESSHCVLSGHRGLPSAKLFTNLDKLVEGDVFMLRILDEILTYEVDRILIVEPQDVEALRITEGKDYCTLVTCTPYGINTHRLLVRGHRIENEEEAETVRITTEAIQIEPTIAACFGAIPLLIVMLIVVFSISGRKRKRAGTSRREIK